jgi:uncharacterized membrane-anchored protein YhcB (DUF1043 family)
MEVQATDSFFKSLKRLSWENSMPYRVYSAIRYKIPYFFKNIWKFRKELWKHRWWDYTFTLMILKRSLEIQEKGMRTKGIEEQTSLDKKLEKMKLVIQYLQNRIDSNFIETAEKKYGPLKLNSWRFEKTDSGNYIMVDDQTEEERAHSKLIFSKAHEMEEKEWEQIWDIIKGKDYKDGSGLLSWWD